MQTTGGWLLSFQGGCWLPAQGHDLAGILGAGRGQPSSAPGIQAPVLTPLPALFPAPASGPRMRPLGKPALSVLGPQSRRSHCGSQACIRLHRGVIPRLPPAPGAPESLLPPRPPLSGLLPRGPHLAKRVIPSSLATQATRATLAGPFSSVGRVMASPAECHRGPSRLSQKEPLRSGRGNIARLSRAEALGPTSQCLGVRTQPPRRWPRVFHEVAKPQTPPQHGTTHSPPGPSLRPSERPEFAESRLFPACLGPPRRMGALPAPLPMGVTPCGPAQPPTG